jgi:DNA-binding GntR family transcriptional regulator
VSARLGRPISTHLIAHLRERILAGVYSPRASLRQDAIAAEFGISRIPVREALLRLEGEGLVDIFAYRGFQVRGLSAAECEEMFELRLKVEPSAVAAGARKATDADRCAAKASLMKLNESLSTGAMDKAGQLDRAFHTALLAPTSQPFTARTLDQLHALSQRYVQMQVISQRCIKRAMREHTTLYEAWESRQYKQTEELTRAHIEATYVDLSQVVRRR